MILGRLEISYGLQDSLCLRADQAVPAGGHGLDPLGLVAQGQAGHSQPVSFFLHAARIGQDQAG